VARLTLNRAAANVRFGSKADIGARQSNVRFTPKSGHCSGLMRCPLCAKSGLMHCSNRHRAYDRYCRIFASGCRGRSPHCAPSLAAQSRGV